MMEILNGFKWELLCIKWHNMPFVFFFSLLAFTVYGGTQPKFELIPQTATTINLPRNGSFTVEYQVTNQTDLTRTLTMVGIQGITQVTTGAGVCGNPFKLASKQHCLLKLLIVGSEIPQNITAGPEICAVKSNSNTPSPFLCSQPSLANSLNITKIVPERPKLTVTPTTISFSTVPQTKSFVVKNESTTVTANDVSGRIERTVLVGEVTQDASHCTSLAPGDTCILSFTTSGVNSVEQVFPIKGTNTKSAPAKIVIQYPSTALITADPTSITLQATTGLAVPQSIFITNPTAPVTATSVAADISSLPGVTQDATDCAILESGETCELIFTPGSQGSTTQTITITGTHASVIQVNIAVNDAAQAPLVIDSYAPASQTIVGDGVSTVTLTLQNTSSTEKALNIEPDLGTSTLYGYLTLTDGGNTCGSVLAGATCTMTFESSATTTQVTGSFLIYGSNTTAVTATLTVTPVPFAYVTDTGTQGISHCLISEGNLTDCFNDIVGPSGTAPEGIALSANNTLAYYTDKLLNQIIKCGVTANTGALSNCVDSGATSSGALTSNTQGLVRNTRLNNVVYVPAYPDTMSTCPLNTDGTIGGCSDATPTYGGGTNFTALVNMALSPDGAYAYLVEGATTSTTGNVYVCTVND